MSAFQSYSRLFEEDVNSLAIFHVALKLRILPPFTVL